MKSLMNLLTGAFVCGLFLSGCAQPIAYRNPQLTQGNIQLHIKSHITTKAEILEFFGSPNITTRDGQGKEVWTYQRSTQVSQASSHSGRWTILLAGQSGTSSGAESSSRMITLIVKFDENDVVSDFNSRTSNF